ncbi:hypothetical protein AB6A23_20810 [Paenibacillus tarimensis]
MFIWETLFSDHHTGIDWLGKRSKKIEGITVSQALIKRIRLRRPLAAKLRFAENSKQI